MRISSKLLLPLGASVLFAGSLALQACTSAAPPAEPAAEAPTFYTGYSIREVMTHIIDPVADLVWDATGVDVTDKGTVEIAPKTDEDWAAVQRGVVSLVEGTNLLKMQRRVAPADDNVSKNPGELHPEEVEALIAKSPGVWNGYVDAMRTEALKIGDIVKARDVPALTKSGDDLDRVCESCHLQFWYPGDRAAVERDRNSKVIPPTTR